MSLEHPYHVKVGQNVKGEDLCVACNHEGKFVIFLGRMEDGRYVLSPLPNREFANFDQATIYARSYDGEDAETVKGLDISLPPEPDALPIQNDSVSPLSDTATVVDHPDVQPPPKRNRRKK